MKTVNRAYTGIPSYLRSRIATTPADYAGAAIGILGIPFDEGSPFLPGSRMGPRAIREHSLRFSSHEPLYDPDADESYLAEELKRDLKLIETQAFRLASAFLLPSTTYPIEARAPSLASMVNLKQRWRVSIKAQIKRLADLDIIPADYATHLYKLYSAKGWSREEPLDRQWAVTEPRVLRAPTESRD